jgi:hypothetical protein
MTVLDYYGSTISLSVIVLWSETNTTVGIGWVLLMNILGSPFACAYIVYRLIMHQTLILGSVTNGGRGTTTTVSSYNDIPTPP